MVEGLGLTTAKAGLIASANFLGYLAGALLAALLVGAATTGAMGLASSTPVFVALRFMGGAASALNMPAATDDVRERSLASMREAGRTSSALLFATSTATQSRSTVNSG